MTRNLKKGLLGALFGGMVLAIGGEIGVRLFGLADFPIYQTGEDIGYIPAPNQKGAFLGKNHWIYNEKSQGAGPWRPEGKKNLLLLGDSIVLGGNLIDEPQRLGPQLEKRLSGWRVWPASAGGWGVPNEIAYLKRFPEVTAAVTAIVWVLDTNDFYAKSIWSTDIKHPRSRPISALWYVFNKYLIFPRISARNSELSNQARLQIQPEIVAAFDSEIQKLRTEQPSRKIIFVIYPEQAEVGVSVAKKTFPYEDFQQILAKNVAADGDTLIEIRDDKRWNTEFYRDGIHPSSKGNEVLADIISDKISHLLNDDFRR